MQRTEPETLSDKAPLALLYHENSKVTRASLARLAEAVAEFASDADELRRSMTGVKTYPAAQRVPLPPSKKLPGPRRRLDKVLAERRSVRAYDDRALPFALLASLLEHAGGVTAKSGVESGAGLTPSLRAWPSGGALSRPRHVAIIRASERSAGIFWRFFSAWVFFSPWPRRWVGRPESRIVFGSGGALSLKSRFTRSAK